MKDKQRRAVEPSFSRHQWLSEREREREFVHAQQGAMMNRNMWKKKYTLWGENGKGNNPRANSLEKSW